MARAINLGGEIGTPAANEPQVDARMPEVQRQYVMKRETYLGCRHRSIKIDDVQRVISCDSCGLWLDPVWVVRELVYYYDTRVDDRIAAIKAFEKREEDRRAQRAARKDPAVQREYKRGRRADELRAAAYNRYKADLARITAENQERRAAKLADEIAALDRDGKQDG